MNLSFYYVIGLFYYVIGIYKLCNLQEPYLLMITYL